MDIEEWKFINGYEGLYEISNLGRVRSYHSNKILKAGIKKGGYLFVNLCKDKKLVNCLIHRLVANVFIPKIDYKQVQVDHINRVRTDNRTTNLRWVTHQENNFNKSKAKNNTSGYTGIFNERGKYRVRLQYNNKKIHGGCFDNIEDAIKRRDELKQQYHLIGENSK